MRLPTIGLLAAVTATLLAAPQPAGGQVGARIVSTSGIPHHDVGNYTKSSYWRKGKPRGIPDSNTWRGSINHVLGALAAEGGDAYLHTGDMVSGRWGVDHDRPKAGIFGPTRTVRDKERAVVRAGELYYRQNLSWWRRVGIPTDRAHFGMGDHEYGNTDQDGVPRPNQLRFVNDHRNVWRRHFIDSRSYPYRLTEGQQRHATYATVLPGGVALVTLDPIVKKDRLLLARIGGPQLRWLDATLRDLRARDDIAHIIVQVEIPPLGPNRAFHSGRQTLRNGGRVFDLLAEHDVDLVLSAEWHELTMRSNGGARPVQIVHGSQMYRGRVSYLRIDTVAGGGLVITAKAMTGTTDGTRKMWAPHRLRAPNEVRFRDEPVQVGKLALDADGRIIGQSGALAEYTP